MTDHTTFTSQQQFPLQELDRAIEALIEFRNAFDNHEDAEDDDPAGDAEMVEDSPGFDPTSRKLANIYGGGAGCALSGDVELNGDEGDYTSGLEDCQ